MHFPGNYEKLVIIFEITDLDVITNKNNGIAQQHSLLKRKSNLGKIL